MFTPGARVSVDGRNYVLDGMSAANVLTLIDADGSKCSLGQAVLITLGDGTVVFRRHSVQGSTLYVQAGTAVYGPFRTVVHDHHKVTATVE